MKRYFFVLLLFIPFFSYNAIAATSASQYGITWTFNTDYTVGQYFNGDYYVIDPGSGVTVNSVSPTPSGGKNGSMKNPVSEAGQGFDSAGADYEAGLVVSFPVSLSGGGALVSSISRTSETLDWSGYIAGSTPVLKTVAILTVVSSAPSSPSTTFRPSPCDRSQTLYTTSTINISLLADLSTDGITLPSHSGFGTVEFFERGFQRPWVLFGDDWQSRYIHPMENMFDYHQEIGEFLSEAMVLLMTDVSGKTTMLHGFLQVVIDYYHAGNSDSSVWAAPYVVGGLLLDESDIYNYWINTSNRTQRGHEKLYHIGDRTESTNSSIIPEGKTWVEWSTGGKYVAFSKQVGEEYEHLHPSEWTCYAPHCKGEVYRAQHDVHPLIGQVLTIIILDALLASDVNAMIDHDPLKDYCDRWMNEKFQTDEYNATGRTYREEMEYYQTFTIYNRLYGGGGTTFINDMWATYRDWASSEITINFSGSQTFATGGSQTLTIK